MGFEPMIRVLQTLALASWPRRLAGGILSEGHRQVKHMRKRVILLFQESTLTRHGITSLSPYKKPLFRGLLERAMG